jgi:hypothetical protein
MGVQARVAEQGKPVLEQLAARWVMAFSMVLIGSFSLIRFLPSPAGLPDYTRFLPVDLSPAQIIGREPAGTATPPSSAEPTEAPAPTLPSTAAGVATITVDSANCRDKPRPNADRVTYLYRDQQLEVLGRNDDLANPWWYVKLPDEGGSCWVWGMTTRLEGEIDEIPIVP